MKKIISLFIAVVFTVLISSSSAFSAAAYFYPMDTKSFNVDIVVQENNVYDVTTTIEVNFNESRHGIYYYLPYRGEVVRMIDGEKVTSQYRNKITNISIPGYNYTTSYESGNIVFQIGDADVYVKGPRTYTIKYTCVLSDDKITALDDVYWNLLPFDWESPIESSAITITMPKEFDSSRLQFIGGYYGDTNTDLMKFDVSGNKITASLKEELPVGAGVTMRLVLPEGYYTGERTDKPIYVLMVLFMLGSFGIILLLWVLFGRDEKIIPVVSFYPPKGMTSAETGYIIDGRIDNRDLISLILFWASKGYLKINQTGKRDFEIIKLRDLPGSAKTYEHTMFDGLFKNRKQVTTDELRNTFYTTLDSTKIMLKNHFAGAAKNNIYTKKSVVARGFSALLLIIPAAAFLWFGLYINMAHPGWYFAAGLTAFVVFICSGGLVSLFDRRKAISTAKYSAGLAALIVVTGLACAAMLAIGIFVIGQFALAAVATALTVFSIILAMRMKTRTAQSNAWMQEILGLKNFIEEAELDRIKLLVEETPEYFYNVLPFAYVFGQTDKWAENFEGIALRQPDWYTSSYPEMNFSFFNAMIFANALNRSMSTVQNSMEVRPAPSGGGSGGGGGFSSGGGFSGGGMGGGGGGSW